MIMQSINLYDTIFIRKTKIPGVRLKSNYSWLPTNEKNIAYKAATLFFEETGINGGVAIEITKRIPVAAGLAGGSTDAAATLVGLNRIYETRLSKQKLMEMGLKFDKFTMEEFMVTALMMYTDYCKTLGTANMEIYLRLAKEWLCDEDVAVKYGEKLATYYDYIVEAED